MKPQQNDNRIEMKPGIPPVNDKRFDQWLEYWHSQHNQINNPNSGARLTARGRQAIEK